MPALSRGQENNQGIINWFITINGTLTDAYEVGFRIIDITGGLPGTQIFPSVVGDYETVTGSLGHFSVGSYFAYDVTNNKGWTPELTASIGTHRIEWRWKISSTAPYQAGQEDFEVLVQSAGSTTDTYITIQDIRDLGVLETDYDDATVLAYINMCQALIDRACRQWFCPKALIIEVDGTDSDLLAFGVPIISIDYVMINGSDEELNSDYYKVYNSNTYPDDRRNPRIKLVRNNNQRSIFTQVNDRLIFRKGRKNQIVKGTFGFIEEDGSTPLLIKRAMKKLVIEKMINQPIFGSSAVATTPPILGSVIEEWTDGHKLKYDTTETAEQRSGYSGLTSDPEILDIIKLYRAPIGCATPADWSTI